MMLKSELPIVIGCAGVAGMVKLALGRMKWQNMAED
jgi:hypothetical protein